MAWQYFLVCLFDFIIAPTFCIVNNQPWTPLTIQGMGVYHASMGAIVGVSVWSRTKEKIHNITRGELPK